MTPNNNHDRRRITLPEGIPPQLIEDEPSEPTIEIEDPGEEEGDQPTANTESYLPTNHNGLEIEENDDDDDVDQLVD